MQAHDQPAPSSSALPPTALRSPSWLSSSPLILITFSRVHLLSTPLLFSSCPLILASSLLVFLFSSTTAHIVLFSSPLLSPPPRLQWFPVGDYGLASAAWSPLPPFPIPCCPRSSSASSPLSSATPFHLPIAAPLLLLLSSPHRLSQKQLWGVSRWRHPVSTVFRKLCLKNVFWGPFCWKRSQQPDATFQTRTSRPLLCGAISSTIT